MNISIVDYHVQDNRYNLYDVYYYNDKIQTMVTSDPNMVTQWITDVESAYGPFLNVGLDIEWRTSFSIHQNPAATLQLCIGCRCLIFQLLYCMYIPRSLVTFLNNNAFYGVGIQGDVDKLWGDHGVMVGNVVDLRGWAFDTYGMRELRNEGLKGLCSFLLGKELEKPKRISLSRWDNEWLGMEQVRYACLDAFVSYEIGRHLGTD
ncbi:3'-5' exonuclease-like [Lycium ferocissimum]|uniref:3'-5' exonuclease-like n=1 Tax=Lycium ferocissimum TaxID=112874 RepID=UPI002815DC98|nr:3'-5' exonuclease-like [Lycium ferocissimum]